jgi:hypothetical protein
MKWRITSGSSAIENGGHHLSLAEGLSDHLSSRAGLRFQVPGLD